MNLDLHGEEAEEAPCEGSETGSTKMVVSESYRLLVVHSLANLELLGRL